MEPYLKYRTRFTSSLKNELAVRLKGLSEQTRIPQSRLLDEAVSDLLQKYQQEEQRLSVSQASAK